MRPLWSGFLAFGLITIPVKLYSAVESSREVHFKLLDKETLTPIKEVRINPETGKEVPWDRVAHGVQYTKGKYVTLSDEDLKALPLPSARTIDLFGFTPRGDVDPLFYDKPYYVGPAEGGGKAYELLRQVLEEEERVGLGRLAIRTREHLVAVGPRGPALVAHTLYYADEVREPSSIPDLPRSVRLHPNERKMATQLIESMAVEFRPAEWHSEYKEALQKLIKAKAEGREPAPAPVSGKVIDLQAALRESLKRAQAEHKSRRGRAAAS
jgi:DNA end-binding protein Ku